MAGTRHRTDAGLAAVAVLALLLPARALAGDDWLTLEDQTATRLVAEAGIGADDTEEKDYAWGDVDRDGDTDLIVVRKEPFTTPGKRRNLLLLNEGGVLVDRTATLAPDFLDETNDRDVALVDVDLDGWLDVVTATTFQDQPRVLMNLGDDGGRWQGLAWDPDRMPELLSSQGIGPHFCGLGVGDVTGDGLPDLYFADYGGVVAGDDDLDDRLLINDPANPGFFLDETEERTEPLMVESCFGTHADIADMNGDGWADVVKATGIGSAPPGAGCPEVSILYNDGTGHFDFEQTVNSSAPYHSAVADFTQDGRLDLFVVDDVFDHYLVNTGNDAQGRATFDTTTFSSDKTNGFGGNATFADMDGDGVLDVLVADVDVDISGCSRRLAILQGQGIAPNITYADPLGTQTRPWTPNGTFDIAPFDIDGDGGTDLVIGTCTGTLVFMAPDLTIFGDGFESGDTAAWDTTRD